MQSRPEGTGPSLSLPALFFHFIAFGLLVLSGAAFGQANSLTITRAEWVAASNSLIMEGRAISSGTVNLRNAGIGGASFGSASVSNNRWTRTQSGPNPVPCFVQASKSGSLTIQLAVTNAPATCGPQTTAQRDHATMTSYDGPQTCLRCHENQGRRMHGSVHYQQNGPTDFTTNIAGKAGEGPAGDPTPVTDLALAINTYCGTHENSPRFTCAGCHVGNGRFQATPTEFAAMSPTAQLKELKNIDCLMCHQRAYKRFPDWTGTSLGFETLTILNAKLGTAIVPATGELELIEEPGATASRNGFSGIPIVDPTTKDFEFRPMGAAGSKQFDFTLINAPGFPMSLTTEQAAQTSHRTDRQTCLNCHARAAASDGAKRGDLSTANVNPPVSLDVHMSPQTGGVNLTCSNCHNVNQSVSNGVATSAHRLKGRGLDLRANDAPRFTCDNAGCHSARPHGSVSNGSQIDRHMTKVACQTCHIPTYAKEALNSQNPPQLVGKTEIVRTWDKRDLSQTACNGRGGWLPREIKAANLTPTYTWFNGTSEIYYLGEKLAALDATAGRTKPLDQSMSDILGFTAGTKSYVLGKPNGSINDTAAKIYPMKEHWGKLAVATAQNPAGVPVNSIIPQSTFEFFRTGSWCRSVAKGLGYADNALDGVCLNQDSPIPQEAEAIPVHTYQTLNHGVEVQTKALGAGNTCGACHSVIGMNGGPARMNLKADLGYSLKTNIGLPSGPAANGNWTCTVSCHDNKPETGAFREIHEKGDHRSRGCSACHAQITNR